MMSGEWVFIVNQNLELALLSLAKSYLKLSGSRASSRSCTFQFSLDQNSKSVQKFSTSSSYDLVLKTQGKARQRMDLVLEKQFLFPFLLPLPSFYIYYFMMTLTSSRHGRWGISYIHYTLVYQETLTRRLIDSIKNGGRMYIVLIKPTDITLHVQPIPLHLLHLV